MTKSKNDKSKHDNLASEGKRDELTGRAKKAAGELTDNDDLKREGSIDKAKGKTKQAVDKAADALRGDD